MAWYDVKGDFADTVFSTRVRLARNLCGFPFGKKLSNDAANEVISRIEKALAGKDYNKQNLDDLSPVATEALVEQHLISREFATKKTPHALFRNDNKSLSLMACEEDHIRLQCILPGLALQDAFRIATECDDLLDASLDIAFDERLGYLTHCPTNLGTAMRASVMMFLPALTMAGKIDSLASNLSKIGLTMRGFYGEGTRAQGTLYQISNQITLGLTEEDILSKLSEAVKQITESEQELRGLITPEKNPQIVDKIGRAEGILRHAYLLSSEELLSYYSDVRLGIALGLVENMEYQTLDTLLIEMMPYNLTYSEQDTDTTERARDLLRAKRVRETLSKT